MSAEGWDIRGAESAAEAFRALQDRVRTFEDALDEAMSEHGFTVFEYDRATGRLRWSDGAEVRIGLARGSMVDLHAWKAVVPDQDFKDFQQAVERAAAQKAARFQFRYRLLPPHAAPRVMEGSGRLYYDDNGHWYRIVGTNLDVTERTAQHLALQARKLQLKAMLDAVPDAMVVVDEEGIIRHVNAAAVQTLGYTSEAAVGESYAILSPAEAKGPHDDVLGRYLRVGRNRVPHAPLRTRARHADGTELAVEVRIGEVPSEGERLFAISLRNIHQQLNAEERLRTLSEQLTHATRVNAMGEMAAGIAHEINQPLAAMTNYLEAAKLLLADMRGDERPAELVQLATAQALRAGAIIRRLQKFVSRGEVDVRAEPVEETVRDAVNLIMVGRVQYDVRVSLAFDRGARSMMADRVQVQQVIVNLLRNAIEALQQMPQEHADILVRAAPIGDMIEFSVSDTGPGIPESVLAQLYEPFSTTKGNKGMGVGLTISKRIVEAHGGQMWAENRVEGGACFRFTIPMAGSEAEAA